MLFAVFTPTVACAWASSATVWNFECGMTYRSSVPGSISAPAATMRRLTGLLSNLPAICARMNDT